MRGKDPTRPDDFISISVSKMRALARQGATPCSDPIPSDLLGAIRHLAILAAVPVFAPKRGAATFAALRRSAPRSANGADVAAPVGGPVRGGALFLSRPNESLRISPLPSFFVCPEPEPNDAGGRRYGWPYADSHSLSVSHRSSASSSPWPSAARGPPAATTRARASSAVVRGTARRAGS